MESSAYEALITAVNVTIFIIATTIAIILFTTVLDLSEYASDSLTGKSNGSIIVDSKDPQVRKVTGNDLISYYTNNKQANDTLKVWISDVVFQELDVYIQSQKLDNTFANKTFEMTLYQYDDSTFKETYLFKPIT